MSGRRVVVTGLGALTPFGPGIANLLSGLREARTATSAILGVDTKGMRCQQGGEVGYGLQSSSEFHLDRERITGFGIEAGREALAHAGVAGSDIQLLAVGQGTGEIRAMEEIASLGFENLVPHPWRELPMASSVTQRMSDVLAPQARNMTFSNACAASSSAIGFCLDSIRSGDVDVAIAGGVEILTRPTLAGFNALHALSEDWCRPFSSAGTGTLLGEGAAWLVMADRDWAASRGTPMLAEVRGCGSSSDAYHPTRPEPSGVGAQMAMKQALEDSRLYPDEIDYINAHGTGTFSNDDVEVRAIVEVFGDAAKRIPISSTKSQLGHGVHACGAIEAVVCVLAISEGILPPTTNWAGDDGSLDAFDFVPNASRDCQVRHALSNSFSFGGFNISLVFSSANE